eukprot:COSAG01_NODE_12055_length_1806_cov_1.285714_2_plen_107_part_01
MADELPPSRGGWGIGQSQRTADTQRQTAHVWGQDRVQDWIYYQDQVLSQSLAGSRFLAHGDKEFTIREASSRALAGRPMSCWRGAGGGQGVAGGSGRDSARCPRGYV